MAIAKVVQVLFVVVGVYETNAQGDTILSVLDKTNGLGKFRSWCEPVSGLLSGSSWFLTVFAFNDSSYSSIPSNSYLGKRLSLVDMDDRLKEDYVKTYIVLAQLSISDLVTNVAVDGSREGTYKSANGNTVFTAERNFREWGAETSTGVTHRYINGARIVGQPISVVNGLIYILDRPPDLPSTDNVLRWITNNGDGSGITTTMFANLMQRLMYEPFYTSTISPIAASQKVTFFLPSEAALAQVSQQKLATLSRATLAKYFRQHYIPDRVLYTSFVNHQESVRSGEPNSQVLFMRNNNQVTVQSGGVTATVIHGNITVGNGVIHVIDAMLGYAYMTLDEQIKKECSMFHRLLWRLNSNLKPIIAQGDINMFCPTNAAMTRIRNLVNYNQNRSLIDFMVRLSIVKDGSMNVSRLNGNYGVRQHRQSNYRNMRLVIYNDRNETWVNGGHVRAKIVKRDLKATKGRLQVIDAVLGVPSMDIPHLIYYDDYLLRTYYDLRSVGLVEYLRDPRFDNSSLPPRTFDSSVNGQGLYGNNMYQQTTRNPFANPHPTQYPNENTDNNQYPSNGNYSNANYPNNNNNSKSNYPNNNFQNQYPQNQPVANYGKCRNYTNVCKFTYFIPSDSAIFNYKMTSYGRQISLDPNLYRYILRRTLILDHLIYLEDMVPSRQGNQFRTHTGEVISVRKETDNLARITWMSGGASDGLMSARIIMWDLGATNGVVHIIENVLSVSADLQIDPSGAVGNSLSGGDTVKGPILRLMKDTLAKDLCKRFMYSSLRKKEKLPFCKFKLTPVFYSKYD